MQICIHGLGIAGIATWFRLKSSGFDPCFSYETLGRDQEPIASLQSTALIHGARTNHKHAELLSNYEALLGLLNLSSLETHPFRIERNGQFIVEEYAIIPFELIASRVREKATFDDPSQCVHIWATGSEIQNTPFDWLPLKPARGVWIRLERPKSLEPNFAYRKRVNLIVDTDSVLIGATVRWDDLNAAPSEAEISELRLKASEIFPELDKAPLLSCGYGIRPASYDRFPLVGRHPEKADHYVINGLGSLGFSKAFEAAKVVVETLKNPLLDHPYNLSRSFKKYYYT